MKSVEVDMLGEQYNIPLTYYQSGKKIGSAPVILINHPLTANAFFSGANGWWKEIVGKNKVIDSNRFTIISFNIPGNGIDVFSWRNLKQIHAGHIAELFLKGLKKLKIKKLFAIIGGSIGGGISWEMAAISPKICQNLIPIASDWKSTDWVIANTFIQNRILKNSNNPIRDARMHAMLMYRTPESFSSRFDRSKKRESDLFNVESWLLHHGQALLDRFSLKGYLTVNHLLGRINILRSKKSFNEVVEQISAKIHIISVNSDLLFLPNEDKITYKMLRKMNKKCTYSEISSVHGHDAFLIENEQMRTILETIFKL